MERDASAGPPATTTFNILFVCTGNTCRSPMAEVAARRAVQQRGWSHVQVASAGTAAAPGHSAAAQAQAVVGQRGLDLSAHGSQPLTPELIAWADLILAMSPSHLHAVAAQGGADKAALLGAFAAGEGEGGEPVPDPFGADEAVYAETLRELERLIERSLDRLAPILHP